MYDTCNIDTIATALLTLVGCLNSPRQDDVLLEAAGVSLDRALFPLLVRLSMNQGCMKQGLGIARLAEQVGRDASTVSRQVAKLEQMGLVERPQAGDDRRLREAAITEAGARMVTAITEARRRLLGGVIADWTEEERRMFPVLLDRLSTAMRQSLDRHGAA